MFSIRLQKRAMHKREGKDNISFYGVILCAFGRAHARGNWRVMLQAVDARARSHGLFSYRALSSKLPMQAVACHAAAHKPPPWPPDDLGGLKGEDGRGMTGSERKMKKRPLRVATKLMQTPLLPSRKCRGGITERKEHDGMG